MATNLFLGFKNEISGESFRCISHNEEAFTFQWTVQPHGYIPFEHIHLAQDEVFHVQQGALRISIGGVEHIVSAGQSITVPKGQPHVACNNTAEPLETVVEYRPGLDNYQFFQCFGGLLLDRDTTKNGTVNIAKMFYFTKKMRAKCLARPTSIPAPVFNAAINVFFAAGTLLGWHKLYTKYTGDS